MFKTRNYEIILQFIKSRQTTLKEINFLFCKITDDFLKQISRIKNLNLTSLNLSGSSEFTNIGLRRLLETQKNIRNLNISSCKLPPDESMMIISEFLPEIRILRIADSDKQLTEVSFYFV